jgi:hypothetical protein
LEIVAERRFAGAKRSDRNVSVPIGTFLFRFAPFFGGLGVGGVNIAQVMGQGNANRPGEAAGGGSGEHGAKRVAAGTGARVARGRRPRCAAGAEPIGGAEDGAWHPRRGGTVRQTALDGEAFDVLIVQQWTKTLRGPYDWGDWPLARYTLGAGVLSAVERYAGTSVQCTGSAVEHLAWVCAMVACGRASRLRSIEARPRDGEEQQQVRADGARAWCCSLERDALDGPRLDYWIHPSGLVEFESVSGEG